MASAGNGMAAPAENWHALLYEAATEVFAMMVGAQVTASEDANLPSCVGVTGVVGIAGALSAVFSLRCSEQSAVEIASQMLGVPAQEAAAQRCDAVGEICNMVAGHFKAKIGLEAKCMLSVPTVVTGRSYELRSPAGSERLEMPLLYEQAPIWIALEIRK